MIRPLTGKGEGGRGRGGEAARTGKGESRNMGGIVALFDTVSNIENYTISV